MSSFLNLGNWTGRRHRPVLGLAFNGARVEGAVLRFFKGTTHVTAAFAETLSIDTESGDPAAVGRELRVLLEAALIRERTCVVVVSGGGLLVTQTEVPDLPDADTASLLTLEAEKEFHGDVSGLRIADSRCRLPDGRRFVTLAALSPARFTFLQQVLIAARLKPAGISPAITELQPPSEKTADGVVAISLSAGTGCAGLQITVGGGVAALRSIEGAVDISTEAPETRADPVAREIRITLGQLPESLQRGIRRIRVFGPRRLAESLAAGLVARLGPAGFSVAAIDIPPTLTGPSVPPGSGSCSPAVAAAGRRLSGKSAALEFLPPKASAIEQFLARHSTGGRRTTWGVAGAITTLVALLFLIQQIQLYVLESRWSKVSAKVHQLQVMQQDSRRFRPWAAGSFRSLRILEAVSRAFPENGSVTAKLIEIRESGEVVCTGTASDSGALLQMVDRLNAAPGVSGVHNDQIKGKSLLQFTLNFHWNRRGTP